MISIGYLLKPLIIFVCKFMLSIKMHYKKLNKKSVLKHTIFKQIKSCKKRLCNTNTNFNDKLQDSGYSKVFFLGSFN